MWIQYKENYFNIYKTFCVAYFYLYLICDYSNKNNL
jgi:hypothetical protein